MDPESYYTETEISAIAAAKSELKKIKASYFMELTAADLALTASCKVYDQARKEHSAIQSKLHEADKKFDALVIPIHRIANIRKQEAETGLSADELLARRVHELGGADAVLEILASCRDEE